MHFLFLFLLTLLQSPGSRTGEIIGGHEVKPHSRPYMAYLTSRTKNHCGAFLIREDFLLTAAHCWGRSIDITLGAHNVKKSEDTQQLIPVVKAIPHPQYDKCLFRKDIMLLQLMKKANVNNEVQPLPLPKKEDWIKPGISCTVAGWGRTLKNRSSDTLQEVAIKVRPEQECKKKYSKYNNTTQICAGDPKEQKASYKGDSGGPLICDVVVQGIVSYGSRNGRNPRVYTRISSFLTWIKETMNAHEY